MPFLRHGILLARRHCWPLGCTCFERVLRLFSADCSVHALVKRMQRRLEAHGVSEAGASAEYIVAEALGKKMIHQVAPETPVASDVSAAVEQMVSRRARHEPVQYIVGGWDFRGLSLRLRPPVFIPRPETEQLVGLILASAGEESSFLEIGCGSGAISLSLLKELPQSQAVAVDQSPEACALTRENAVLASVEDRLIVMEHTFGPDSDLGHAAFDFVVSNPPYVPTSRMADLQEEIRLYEDPLALDGGADGMDVIRLILQRASELLKPEGFVRSFLWLEVDSTHPDLIQTYVAQNPRLQLRFIHHFEDYQKIARFCHLQFIPDNR